MDFLREEFGGFRKTFRFVVAWDNSVKNSRFLHRNIIAHFGYREW